MSARQRAWVATGRVVSWLTWPGVWLVLYGSRRTRILVVCRQQVLLTKGWMGDGKWQLPGGGLHKGESSSDGALRELYEETGIHLPPELLRRHSEHAHSDKGVRYSFVLFVARVTRKQPLKPQPFEISEVAWVDRRTLNRTNANPDVLTALQAWGRK